MARWRRAIAWRSLHQKELALAERKHYASLLQRTFKRWKSIQKGAFNVRSRLVT